MREPRRPQGSVHIIQWSTLRAPTSAPNGGDPPLSVTATSDSLLVYRRITSTCRHHRVHTADWSMSKDSKQESEDGTLPGSSKPRRRPPPSTNGNNSDARRVRFGPPAEAAVRVFHTRIPGSNSGTPDFIGIWGGNWQMGALYSLLKANITKVECQQESHV